MTHKIVVTGGAGMVGTALVKILRGAGFETIVVDNYSREAGRVKYRENGYSYRWLDTRTGDDVDLFRIDAHHLEELADIFRGADAVVNLAADVGGVHYNRSSGAAIYAANAVLQAIPVVAAEMAKVPTFLQMSSVCVYSPVYSHDRRRIHTEQDELGTVSVENTGYALAKRDGERLAFASNIDRVIVARPVNIIGAEWDYYDDKAHVVPALIRRASGLGPALDVYAAPDTVREFLFVEEAAQMLATLLDHGENRTVYNLPSSTGPLTMEQIATTILAAMGEDKRPLFHTRTHQTTEVYRVVDGKRMDALFKSDSRMAGSGLSFFEGYVSLMADSYFTRYE